MLTDGMQDRVDKAVEELLIDGASPFWLGVVDKFPESIDGADPAYLDELEEVAKRCVGSWVLSNVPGADGEVEIPTGMEPLEPNAEQSYVDAWRPFTDALTVVGFPAAVIYTGGGIYNIEARMPGGGFFVLTTGDGIPASPDEFTEEDEVDGFDCWGIDLLDENHEPLATPSVDDQPVHIRGNRPGDLARWLAHAVAMRNRAEREGNPDLNPWKSVPLADFGIDRTGTDKPSTTDPIVGRDDPRREVADTATAVADEPDRSPRFEVEYPLTEVQLDEVVRVAEWLRDEQRKGAAVEEFRVRPATADDEVSMITKGEICHYIESVVTDDGGQHSMYTAIGQSGTVYDNGERH